MVVVVGGTKYGQLLVWEAVLTSSSSTSLKRLMVSDKPE